MKLLIEIELDNAAFEDDDEVLRILKDAANRLPLPLCHTPAPINLHDANGNHVGTAEIAEN